MNGLLPALRPASGIAALAQSGRGGSPSPSVQASAAREEVCGVVGQADVALGRGMPVLSVRTDHGTTRVQLGSLCFRIERGFDPEAGASVAAEGFRPGAEAVARTFELPEQKRTIVLRSERGVLRGRAGRDERQSQGKGAGCGSR